jgi:polysaccharide export outer membrane protein
MTVLRILPSRLFALGGLLVLAGCVRPYSVGLTSEDERSSPPAYRIGAGDVLEISVWKNPDLSRTVSVVPTGTISLPLLNDVQAAGLTPEELRTKLTEGFSKYVSHPEVSVLPKEVHSYSISVVGQANKPGRYELQRQTTVLEAIALAGGLNQFGSYSDVFVLRNDGKEAKRIPFDYVAATSNAASAANFYLHAGDIVVVP